MSVVNLRPGVSGPVLFARFAYPPNALGYCGPNDPGALLESANAGHLASLTHLAHQFDGAWPYLELIAGCNGLSDPLDRRVVEAYWLGNELAVNVPGLTLASSLDDRFAARTRQHQSDIAAAVAAGGVPQHNFHVFAVYPWLGMLRAGREGPAFDVLERCRIRWGQVLESRGDTVRVRSRSLAFERSRLTLGPERVEEVRRSLDGVGFVDDLSPGEVVSLHWDWVCDRLTPHSLRWLRRCTQRNLDAVNSLAAPGPAVVCGA